MISRDYSENMAQAARENIKEKEYWIDKLSGELSKSIFPYDPVPAQDRTGKAPMESVDFRFPPALFSRLTTVSRNCDFTLHILLLTSLFLLMKKYGGHDDIVVGAPIYKQDVEGEFINTVLALRAQLDKDMSFKELLMNVKKTMGEAVEHQNYPLEALLYHLGMPVTEDDFPLFDTALLLKNIHDLQYLGDIPLNIVFSFERTESGLVGEILYNPARYLPGTVERIAGHFIRLTETALADAAAPVSRVNFLSPAETHQLLDEFNDSTGDFPRDKTLHQLFEEQARQTPDRTALVMDDRHITYRQLDESANRLARFLVKAGAAPGSPIAIKADISPETIIGMTGILKCGGTFLPVDPDSPPDRIEFLLDDSGVSLFLVTEPFHFPEGQTLDFNGTIIDLSAREYLGEDGSAVEPAGQPGGLAYIIYTSGSTGNPKGVMLTHSNIVNQLTGLEEMFFTGIEPLNHILLAPFTFDPSVQQVYSPLSYGGKLYLVDRAVKIDNRELMGYIISRSVHVFDGVPSQLSAMIDFAEEYPAHLRKFTYIVLAGEVFSYELYSRITRYFDVHKIINIYGPTEATINSTYHICGQEDIETGIPIGKPLMNYKVFILDSDLNLAPIGVTGQIFLGGDGIARGYFNRPDLTAQGFIDNPYSPGETIYATGDLGKWLPDGNVLFMGRVDHQVKIRGFRIELGEIEKRLLEHDDIKEAAVIDRLHDNGEKYLCAYVVSDKPSDAPMLRNWLSKSLPDYMVPSFFVPLGKMPLTAHDKLDREALPEPSKKGSSEYTAPRDDIEKTLVNIMAEVLDTTGDHIGIDTDFFDIGGHSLKATHLIARIHKAFDVKIPLVEVFTNSTVRGFADYIKSGSTDVYSPVTPAEPKDYYSVSAAQKRLYILWQMEPGNLAYNMPQAVEGTPGDFDDIDALTGVFRQLAERHESLRTSFDMIDGQPVQKVHAAGDIQIKIDTIQVPGTGETGQIFKDFIQPFDLRQAPLFRAAVAKSPDGSSILLVDKHHIITDGMSDDILVNDFTAISEGRELPPLTLQYKDYAEWQNRTGSTPEETAAMEQQEEFWSNEFKSDPPVLELPADYPRPVIQQFDGQRKSFIIPPAGAASLYDLADRNGTTVYMVLLALYGVFLSKVSGSEDVVTGSPTAGRRHADIQDVIGMFVNTLALRLRPEHDKPFDLFLDEVKTKTLQAIENQDYPFEKLVEKTVKRRDLSRNPLFDVMFSMPNYDPGRPEPGTGSPKEETPAHAAASSSPLSSFQSRVSKFDLTLAALPAVDRLELEFTFCTALFKPETIDRLAVHFQRLVSSMLEDTTRPIAEMDIMAPEQKKQVLADFNDTDAPFPGESTLHQIFEEQAARTPEAAALKYGDDTLSYRQLNDASNALAARLRDKGIGPGSIAAVMMERSMELMIGIFGILKTGGAYLPILPAYPGERKEFIIKDSACKILLYCGQDGVDDNVKETLPAHCEAIDLGAADWRQENGQPPLPAVNRSSDLAYLIYTSGSTGTPKGVVIEHRAIVNRICWVQRVHPLDQSDTIMQKTPAVFDVSVIELFWWSFNGAALCLLEPRGEIDPLVIMDTIHKHRITALHFVPSMLQSFLEFIENRPDKNRLSSLKLMLASGEELFPTHVDMVNKFFTEPFGTRFLNLYGPTEAAVDVTCFDCTRVTGRSRIPIGAPVANIKLAILDRQNHLQPVGIAGQLGIAGVGLARGYLNRPDLTDEKFIDHPVMPGEKLYLTGDLARWLPDGNIEFLGRIDRQVKIRGFRIELGEIEDRLLKHPSIKDAVVMKREKESGQAYLCAYFVSPDESPVNELKTYLARELPEYMVPAFWVPLERIPLTVNGKVDHRELPEPKRPAKAEYIAPGTGMEKTIADAWKEVLDVEQISVEENFFEIGASSLDIIRAAQNLGKKLEKDIPVVTLFRYPSIKSLAAHLSDEKKDTTISNEKVNKMRNKMGKTFKLLKEAKNVR